MKFRLYANAIPNTTVLCFDVNSITADLDIRGIDPVRANTVYFDERIDKSVLIALKGRIELNIPIPPDTFMFLDITDAEKNTTTAKLREVITQPLKTKAVYLTPADEAYLTCLEWFALNSGDLKPGTYKRDNVQFDYYWQMFEENGVPSLTPARIDHDSGIPEFAKKFFDGYTVPVKMFIGTHEWIHYAHDTTSEEECDRNSANYLLSKGYPKLELIQAATKVFPDTPEMRKRTNDLVRFINNW